MTLSKYAPDPDRPDLKKIFVNREGPIARFRDALRDIPDKGRKILMFHGVGGQGKSHLCKRLRDILKDETPKHRNLVERDLHLTRDLRERDPATFMLQMRNAIAANTRITFPAFDIVFSLYWLEARPEEALPLRKEWSLLFRRSRDVAEAGAEAGTTLTDNVLNGLIEGLPFVGMSLRRLIRWGLPVVRTEYQRLTNDSLAHAYDDGKPRPASELLKMLPYFLAQDLRAFLQTQHADTRFVFLIDEYESILSQGGSGELARDEPLDEAMREFVACCRKSMFVFFSRERLRWGQEDSRWQPYLEDAQQEMQGLEDADAEEFLKQVEVEPAEIRGAMLDGARVRDPQSGTNTIYPFMLELQVGHYLTLRDLPDREPAPADFQIDSDDFETARRDLLIRFTRDYDPSFDAALDLLAAGRFFTRDTCALLLTRFNVHFQLQQFGHLCALSFVSEAGEGQFTFHGVIREALIGRLDGESLSDVHACLVEHHSAQCAARPADETAIPDLDEALYHRLQLGGSGLLDWWRDARRPFAEAHLHVALEPLDRDLVHHFESQEPRDLPALVGALCELAQNLAAQGRDRDAARVYQDGLTAARCC